MAVLNYGENSQHNLKRESEGVFKGQYCACFLNKSACMSGTSLTVIEIKITQ